MYNASDDYTDRKAADKLETNAMISMKTLQSVDGSEELNEIELQTKGRFAQRNGKFYVMYEESELTGFEDTVTTIKISDEDITMTRKGKYSSRMVFKQGEKRLCSYNTPYGVIPVGVNPISMKSDLDENGGNVHIEYILDIDNEEYLKNSLSLTVVTRT